MKLSDYLCKEVKENGIPSCILFMVKLGIEQLFKLLGFFIALSLLVGLTLSACPKNILLQLLPPLFGFLFFLYIGITFVAIPFFIVSDHFSQPFRKIVRFIILGMVFFFSFYYLLESPIFELLLTYIGKLFPNAFDCHGGLLELDKVI